MLQRSQSMKLFFFGRKLRYLPNIWKFVLLSLKNFMRSRENYKTNAMRSASQAQSKKVEVFFSSLDDLCDIVHQDVLKNINEEDSFCSFGDKCGLLPAWEKLLFLRAEERITQEKAAERLRREKSKLKPVGNTIL